MHSALAAALLSQADESGIGNESGLRRPGFIPDSVPIWVLKVVSAVVVLVLAWAVARLLIHLRGCLTGTTTCFVSWSFGVGTPERFHSPPSL